MATCEVCGNEYALTFEIHTASGDKHVFDSFECAAQKLAPICEHCGCRILGHGVDVDGSFYCCAHCARESGRRAGNNISDRAGVQPTGGG